MELGHDTLMALRVVVALVNTAPETHGSEQLPDADALAGWVAGQHISGVGRLGPGDVAAVQRLRARLRAVFAATDEQSAAALVNGIIAEAGTTPRLTDHDGYPWHIHYFTPGASVAEHLAADGGMALAQVLAGGGLDRLRACEAPDCAQVLIDLSRNRSRRYCDSRTCGNRLHVAAYRARRRSG